MEPVKKSITVIIDDSDEEAAEGSDYRRHYNENEEEEEKEDIVDRIHSHEWLNGDDIVLGIEVLTKFIFDTTAWVTVVDPGFLSVYIDSKRKMNFPESATTIERRRECLVNTFKVAAPQEKLVILPIFDDSHWSVLFYMNLRRRFYFTDSLGEYHQNRTCRIIGDFIDDHFMEEKGTTITFVKSVPQKHGYECGQYLFMFIYAFIKNILIAQRDSPPPCSREFPITKPLVSNIDQFDNTLTSFIYDYCSEETRQNFITGFIQKIHAFNPL